MPSKLNSEYPKNPLFTATEIIPGLWIGDKNDAHSYFFFKEKNIKVIINCTTDVNFLVGELNIEKRRLSVTDNPSQSYSQDNKKMYNNLDAITSYMYNILNKNKTENVLVHCDSGKQRSPTIVVAYLMKYGKVNMEQAIKYVRTKRPSAFRPKVNFNYALEKWQQSVKNI